MAKNRAVVIGCNYPKTNTPMLGCVNDALSVKSLLEDIYGFKPEDITVLTDLDDTYQQATSINIKDTLKEYVAMSAAGDTVFVHFSGHGVQLPADGEEGEEVDGLDEAIVGSEGNPILDDDLRLIFMQLKKGVTLTVVMDCCHSGGLLDHTEAPVRGGKWKYPEVPEVNIGGFLSMLGWKKGTEKIDLSKWIGKEVKNREIWVQDLIRSISPESKTKIRQTIYDKFGANSSPKIQAFVKASKFSVVGVKVASRAVQKVRTQGCAATVLGFMGMQGSGGTERPDFLLPGQKPPKSKQLPSDIGILISGCQSHEKAADANFSGNKDEAGGVMTNALITIARNHHSNSPDKPLTNRALVMAMKNTLTQAGFSQNPGLEGSGSNADKEFVTGKAVKA